MMRNLRLLFTSLVLLQLLQHSFIYSFRPSNFQAHRTKGLRHAALSAKRKAQPSNKKGFNAPQKPDTVNTGPSKSEESSSIAIPQFDPNRGSFMDIDPEDEAQKRRELQQQLLDENQKLQSIFEEKKIRRSMYGDSNVDEESLAMEEAMEQYDRVRNRVDDQLRLAAQLEQIQLERAIDKDGKEFWIHPLFQELGIVLPNPRGQTAEEFDLLSNLRLIQSSFLGLRPTPQFNDNNLSNSTSSVVEEENEQMAAVDPVFRANSTARKFTKFYPYGYYGHLPMLTLQSPFDIFGNIHSLPEQYYKLLPTLDAFRLSQEFWRQHEEREEDLASLWYAEDQRKEKELRELSPWLRAAIFGLDNDNGTFQDVGDKITSFIEALIYGVIFVFFVNTVLGLSNGLMNFILRREFDFFLQNEWWTMPFQEVLPHLPRFEGVDLSDLSRSLYSGSPRPTSLPPPTTP